MSEDAPKIDINQAPADVLANLPGVGEVLAQRIVEYRETIRPFPNIDELTAVPGISEKMVASFADQIVAIPPAEVEVEVESDPSDEFADFAPADEEPEPDIVLLAAETADPAIVEPQPEPALEAEAAETADEVSELESEPEPEPLPEPEEPSQEPEEPVEETEARPTAVADPIDPPILKETLRRESPPQEPMNHQQTPPAPEPTADPQPQRQGIGLGLWLFGVVLGALLGSILSLFWLSTLNNGNLRYNANNAQLATALRASNQTQTQLAAQVDLLVTGEATIVARLDGLATDQEADQQALTEVEGLLAELDSGLATAAVLLTELEGQTAVLEERVDTIATASETFDTFLNGLRDLLVELQGLPPLPEPTPTLTGTITVTPSPTPTDVGDPSDATDDGTAEPTSPPTRTPRPTSTPFVTATPTPTFTPAPQP